MTLRHPVPPSINKIFLSHTQRSTHSDATYTHAEVQTSTHAKTILLSPLPSTAPDTQSFCNGMILAKENGCNWARAHVMSVIVRVCVCLCLCVCVCVCVCVFPQNST